MIAGVRGVVAASAALLRRLCRRWVWRRRARGRGGAPTQSLDHAVTASTMRLQPRPCGYSFAFGLDHAATAFTTHAVTAFSTHGYSLHLLWSQVRTLSLECRPGQESLSWGGVELALRLPRRALAAPGAALQLSIVEEASGMVRSE